MTEYSNFPSQLFEVRDFLDLKDAPNNIVDVATQIRNAIIDKNYSQAHQLLNANRNSLLPYFIDAEYVNYMDEELIILEDYTRMPSQQMSYSNEEPDFNNYDIWIQSSTSPSGRIIIPNIPSPIGVLTYNTYAQSPSWMDYDAGQLTIGGTVSATNAGTYTARFTPKSGYEWSDGTTSAKTVEWTIGKAQGSLTLSADEVFCTKTSLSKTISATKSTGTLSATSADTSIATVSVSGSNITVTARNATSSRTTTVTIRAEESSNYTPSPSKTVTVYYSIIYGVEWTNGTDPSMTRTDSASSFSDPIPAVGSGSGSSPFDSVQPWSGMTRVNDTQAGVIVRIPKFYYKLSYGEGFKLQISSNKFEGALVSPAHINRGDGAGERDEVFVGAYHCASNFKSFTGNEPLTFTSRDTFRNSIHNLGSNIWQWDYAMYWTICMLYIVEFANWNSQNMIGVGASNDGEIQLNGETDSMIYHTGSNASGGHIRYRYIEDLWANVRDFVDGVYFVRTNYGSSIYVIKNPNNFSDDTGGTAMGFFYPNSGLIKGWTISDVAGYEYALFPNGMDAQFVITYATYICDRFGYGIGKGYAVGGSFADYDSEDMTPIGLFSASIYDSDSSFDFVGSRLMKLP